MSAITSHPRHAHTWTDENTRRRIVQVGDGLSVGYFRHSKHLPDGRIVVSGAAPDGSGARLFAVDPTEGEAEPIDQPFSGYMRIRPGDGRTWFILGPRAGSRTADQHRLELWEVDLPDGTPRLVCGIPEYVPGVPADITCDGRTIIFEHAMNDGGPFPIPTKHSATELMRYINRRRRGAIYTYDIPTGHVGRPVEMQHVSPAHSDTSPADPTLLRYTEDVLECTGQRMFSVRIDGSEQRPLRVQEFGEMITHEFWWADPNFVGYTYMDRRGDETLYSVPWCEYADRPTHLGICDLRGEEVYRSDPLNSYHAHLYMSPNGGVVCGEGTAYNNFICAGSFSMKETRLNLEPLATIHTPWIPTRGSGTNCAFSNDGRWLFYNDTVDGKRQLCRVEVDA